METTIHRLIENYRVPINWSGSRSLIWPEPNWNNLAEDADAKVCHQEVVTALGFKTLISCLSAFDECEYVAPRFAVWCALKCAGYVNQDIFKEIAKTSDQYVNGKISIREADHVRPVSRLEMLKNAKDFSSDHKQQHAYLAAEYAVLWAQIATFQTESPAALMVDSVGSVYREFCIAVLAFDSNAKKVFKEAESHLFKLIKQTEAKK